MIIIGFTAKTGKVLPRVFCTRFRHCAVVIPLGGKFIFTHVVKGGVQTLELGARDLKILGENGWVFIGHRVARQSRVGGGRGSCRSCVKYAKNIIGLKTPFVLTPYQLYKKLNENTTLLCYNKPMSFWKYCFKIYIRFWPVIAMTLFGYTAVIVFDSLMPAFIAKNLTIVLMQGKATAYAWLVGIAIVFLIVTAFHFIESRVWSWRNPLIRRYVHMDLYNRVMRQKQFSEFKNYPPEYWTDAIYNIQNTETTFTLMIDIPRRTLALLSVFTINSVIFFDKSPMLALFVLVPAIAIIGYTIYIALRVREQKRRIDRLRVNLRKDVADSLGNIRCVRANARLDQETKFIDAENLKFTKEQQNNQMIQWKVIIIPRIINAICIVGAVWAGMNAYFSGRLELDMFVFMIVSMASLLHLAEEVKHPILNYIDRIASVMRSFDIIYGKPEASLKGRRRVNKIQTIDVNNVTFEYGDGENILEKLSFHIGPREHVGINGRSGAGKTTMFNLILGLYRPNEGEVFINGIPLAKLDISRLRRQIFMSVQNAPMINRTIADNIKFANPHCSRDQMVQAAKFAEIHDFIMSLGNGYETVVGNVGSRMSGGQINRIMLARAFASGAEVMLLDEPTAAVDSKTEHKIMNTIRTKFRDRTVVIVSHNKKVLDTMDRTVNFKKTGSF